MQESATSWGKPLGSAVGVAPQVVTSSLALVVIRSRCILRRRRRRRRRPGTRLCQVQRGSSLDPSNEFLFLSKPINRVNEKKKLRRETETQEVTLVEIRQQKIENEKEQQKSKRLPV